MRCAPGWAWPPSRRGATWSRASFLRVASGSPRERLWARVAAERQGHLPVVDAPPADAGLAPLELEVHAADFAAEDALPVCPGPFGGTTLVVLPAGTPADEVAAWKALVSNDPLAKQSPFTRLRVAVLDGDRPTRCPRCSGSSSRSGAATSSSRRSSSTPTARTMRALRDLAAGFEGRMTLHWRPGLGGR
jgi:hypothetical protein